MNGSANGSADRWRFLAGQEDRARFLDRLADLLQDLPGEHTLAVLSLKVAQLGDLAVARGDAAVELVLVEVASRLRDRLESVDAVIWTDGDTSFVGCVLEDSADQFLALHERVQSCFDEPFLAAHTRLYLTARIGMAFSSDVGDDPEELVGAAEAARLTAIRSDENQVVVFDKLTRVRVRDQFELNQALHRAISRHELHLAFERIVDLPSGDTSGVAVSPFWLRLGRDRISADAFLPSARSSGLIPEIGNWLVVELAKQAAVLEQIRAGAGEGFTITVPAAVLSSGLRGIGDQLLRALVDLPGEVCVELTERCVGQDLERAVNTIQWLRQGGVGVILAKFGTGGSATEVLQRVQVAGIKIDRYFIRDIHHDERSQAVVASMIELAHRLGTYAIAEGVESREELAVLESLSCDKAQGSLFGEISIDW